MKTISIVTGTRAEYGLLKPLILELSKSENFYVRLAVTGMHLSPEFGYTYKEIEKDGILVDEKIEILLSSDTPLGVSKAMGLCIISFSEYFNRIKPDLLVVLGDRYEIFSVCVAAMNLNIPIAHIHGGETTQGALDEAMRHGITKMSHLHFTSCDIYRNRVIQMGECPKNVHTVGALAMDVIKGEKFLHKKKLEKYLDIILKKPYFMVVFHSETLEEGGGIEKLRNLLKCINNFIDYNFIFILGNADAHGRELNNEIKNFNKNRNNVFVFDSIGHMQYLSALKYSIAILGNSSSGIIEACALNIPSINIGDRQKGRIQGRNVINISGSKIEIKTAIDKVISKEFSIDKSSENPYGDGMTSKKISEILEEYLSCEKFDLKKEFYDIL